jgi:uncharacterized membrane protein
MGILFMTGRLRLRLDQARAGIGIALALAFVSRWLISGRNSYWLDELWSVEQYGLRPASGLAAMRADLVHPPLYPVVLHYWIRLFGDGEVATRFLSNLYVAGAGFCLYATVREAAGRRRALMAAIFFSLMFEPFYYAMETRSYAQTLLLSSLSSVLLFRFMRVLVSARAWQDALRSRACILLAISNFALLMTHYYNAFFLASQAVFLLGWVAWRGRAASDRVGDGTAAKLATKLVLAAVPLAVPVALMLLMWGSVMVTNYHNHDDEFVATGAVTNPFSAFMREAVGANFLVHGALLPLSGTLLALCAALLAMSYVEQGAATRPTRRLPPQVGKHALGAYSGVTAFVPFVFAYALFALSTHERYEDRYFVFTAPSLAIMLVLALEQGVSVVDRLVRRRRATRGYLAHSALFTLIATAIFVLPGTYEAATRPKADWRGVASLVAAITREDPGHQYVLFSTYASLDYYLKRVGATISTRGLITKQAEKAGRFPFAKDRERLTRKDFLILTFTHQPASAYKKTIAALDAMYEVHQRLLFNDGRGVLIYRLHPPR